jgi:hypothetical protein
MGWSVHRKPLFGKRGLTVTSVRTKNLGDACHPQYRV